MCVQATKLADDGNGECAELIATVRALVEAVVIEPEVQGRLAQLTETPAFPTWATCLHQ